MTIANLLYFQKELLYNMSTIRDFGEYKEYMQKIIKEYEKD